MCDRTSGNPFFIGELLRHADGVASEIGLPESVKDVVAHRLRRLPDAVTRALRAAAVIGPVFTLQLLEAVPAAIDDGSTSLTPSTWPSRPT